MSKKYILLNSPISPTDHGVKAGHLLFTLKTRQLFQSGTVVGETVLPLDELSSVDTSAATNVKHKFLNMNLPTAGNGELNFGRSWGFFSRMQT